MKTGQLTFAAGENTTTVRFQAFAPIMNAQVELSVGGVVGYRRTVTPIVK